MSAAILDFGPRPERTLRYRLSQFRRDMEAQAAATDRAKREAAQLEAFRRNHPITNGPEAA